MYYTDNGTDLYQGDMKIGDRKATAKEINVYLGKQEQAITNAGALSYLSSTDWYVIRFQESKVAIPIEITEARAAARLAVI